MRNFDDVAPNLASLRQGEPPDVSDPIQRIADLRAAGFANDVGDALTELGERTLAAWEAVGVDNDDIGDELARLLLMVLEGQRIGDAKILGFLEYWANLRANFDPFELIESWDALYALNYMDVEHDGFSPGAIVRNARVPASEITFDIGSYARSVGADAPALAGARRIEDAIRGKVPRGRHRSTFCMALEITLGGAESAKLILRRFGVPRRPRQWTAFSREHKRTLLEIIETYDLAIREEHEPDHGLADLGSAGNELAAQMPVEGVVASAQPMPLTLPEAIDFEAALVPAPTATARSPRESVTRSSPPKKADYLKKAQVTDEVGKVGEQFALAYERWRLRKHPELLARIDHVSLYDDSLGFDILSFETDGTSRHVEVKATVGEMSRPFFLSDTEALAAAELGECYVILRVCNLTSQPTCCEIRAPFDGKLVLTPTTYLVEFV